MRQSILGDDDQQKAALRPLQRSQCYSQSAAQISPTQPQRDCRPHVRSDALYDKIDLFEIQVGFRSKYKKSNRGSRHSPRRLIVTTTGTPGSVNVCMGFSESAHWLRTKRLIKIRWARKATSLVRRMLGGLTPLTKAVVNGCSRDCRREWLVPTNASLSGWCS